MKLYFILIKHFYHILKFVCYLLPMYLMHIVIKNIINDFQIIIVDNLSEISLAVGLSYSSLPDNLSEVSLAVELSYPLLSDNLCEVSLAVGLSYPSLPDNLSEVSVAVGLSYPSLPVMGL